MTGDAVGMDDIPQEARQYRHNQAYAYSIQGDGAEDDAERERISLGVKQLAEDPFNNWVALNKKGAIVTGKVTAVDAKGATVELADGVEGYLRASEASRDRVEDATLVLSVGDDVEAKFTGVDRKNRAISLSVRAKDEADEKDAIATVNKQEDANFSNNAMAEAFKAAKGE